MYGLAGAKSPTQSADFIGPAKAVPLLQGSWIEFFRGLFRNLRG
jgi:hypothetical protein